MAGSSGSMIKRIREYSGLSQKEVAERSGINFRSLQDYEQGHKDICGARADTVYRLSLALGCSMEELLSDSAVYTEIECRNRNTATDSTVKQLSHYNQAIFFSWISEIESQKICSPQYRVLGCWRIRGKECFLRFCYKGNVVSIPFQADFSMERLPWLAEAAGLEIDSYIRRKHLEENV